MPGLFVSGALLLRGLNEILATVQIPWLDYGHLRLELAMSRIRLALISALVLLSLSACHTVEGIGKDVKSAGGAIEDAGNR